MKKLKGLTLICLMFLTILPIFTAAGADDMLPVQAFVGKPGSSDGQITDWGYTRIGSDTARASTSGAVQVAVLDTGADYDHPDLAAAIGWCYNAIDRTSGCSEVDDINGHGTHTSGTIAALDNDQGTLGIAADHIELYIIKVLGPQGGSWEDLNHAIRVASEGPDGVQGTDDDAEVISMSLGGDLSSSPDIQAALQEAVDYAMAGGTVLVAAAGNEGDGDDTTQENSWPAMSDGVIAVAATDSEDNFPSWSNTGSYVDISAPGVSITSLWLRGGTKTISGTSMACPHVAAVAAMIMANNPGFSPDEVANRLYSTAEDLGYSNNQQGAGLVDAAAAV